MRDKGSSCGHKKLALYGLIATTLSLGVLFVQGFSFAKASERTGTGTSSIINGDPVGDPELWPWMVSLTANHSTPGVPVGGHACGASLIMPDRVLTAAHCVVSSKPSDFDVVIGRKDLSDQNEGERIEVTGISMHPNALAGGMANDVAVIKLAEPAQAPPVELATQNNQARWEPGTPAVALGYGLFDNEGGTFSQVLRRGNLSIISDQECNGQFLGDPVYSSTHSFEPTSMICAQDPDTPRTQSGCFGDSGGPLVVGNEQAGYLQVGVFSWNGSSVGKICDPAYPSVYARIPALHSFVTQPDADLVFKPFNQSPLEIVGDPTVGQALQCSSQAGWSGNPYQISYEWIRVTEERVGQNTFHTYDTIEGAMDPTYIPVNDDVGSTLICQATAVNAGGFHRVRSEPTSEEVNL